MMKLDVMNLNHSAEGLPALDNTDLRILRIVALCSALVSLIFSTIVLSWFIQMRRNFRHQLIMLLIITDFFKAIWQFLFPVVVLARGGINTGDAYCTATGYLVAYGIESSDFAILMIAIHSALSIFRPRNGTPGKGGLYKYRNYMYLLWIIFPALMSSLAFLNKDSPYSAQGTFCYLPVRPFWYRLALAWIPRYIIMATISILYIWIYVYVKWTFRSYRTKFTNLDLENSDASRGETTRRGSQHSIIGNMLRFGSFGHHHHDQSQHSKEKRPMEPLVENEPSTTFPMVPGFSFSEKIIITTPPEPSAAPDDLAPELILSPTVPSAAVLHSPRNRSPARTRSPLHLSPNGTPPPIPEYEFDGPSDDRRNTATTSNTSAHMLGSGEDTENSMSREVRLRHIAIQRQLRFLFIYPLVYLLIWIIPLINNGRQYSASYAANPSLPLQILVAISVPIQGALDSAFFTLREKPWRYIPPHLTQPWWSKLLGRKWVPEPEQPVNTSFMTIEARRAYERREQERREYEIARRERQESKRRQRLARKNSMSPMTWWDRLDDNSGSRDQSPHMTRTRSDLFRTWSRDPEDATEVAEGPNSLSRSATTTSLRATTPKSDSRGLHWGSLVSTSSFRPKLRRNKSSNTSHNDIKELDEDPTEANAPPSDSSPSSPTIPAAIHTK